MKRGAQRNLGVGVVGLIVCAFVNIWIFRFGVLYGLVGLNLTKHVGVAVLCQAVGVNKGKRFSLRRRTVIHPPQHLFAGCHAFTRHAK